jgi:hypothetical protein
MRREARSNMLRSHSRPSSMKQETQRDRAHTRTNEADDNRRANASAALNSFLPSSLFDAPYCLPFALFLASSKHRFESKMSSSCVDKERRASKRTAHPNGTGSVRVCRVPCNSCFACVRNGLADRNAGAQLPVKRQTYGSGLLHQLSSLLCFVELFYHIVGVAPCFFILDAALLCYACCTRLLASFAIAQRSQI